jgi:hypothetical protein
VNIAAEPVQLGDRDRALAMLGFSQRDSQLRAASKRVRTSGTGQQGGLNHRTGNRLSRRLAWASAIPPDGDVDDEDAG